MPPKKSTKAPAPTASDFKVGDVVLTKLKGYPDWPGKVVDSETVPPAVLKYKGGKPIVVIFFPDADYVWAHPKELKQLTPKIIDAYLSDTSKKAGKLRQGYEIAKDPSEWEQEQAKLASAQPVEEEEDEEDDVDMLAEDGEAKPKKRKRAADAKPAKATKSKAAATKKEPKAKKETAPASKKRKTDEAGKDKASKDKKKDVAGASASADHAEDNSEESKTVMGWRAQLQKAFLSKGLPEASDMPKYDETFTKMEKFEMQPQWLASTKLGKVLKKMAALDSIPREEEFKIKERSAALVEKWREMLNKEPASAAADVTMADASAAAPTSTEEKKAESAAPAEPVKEEANTNGVSESVNAEGQTNGVAEEAKPAASGEAAPAVAAAPAAEEKKEEPAAEAAPPAPAAEAPTTNGDAEAAPAAQA